MGFSWRFVLASFFVLGFPVLAFAELNSVKDESCKFQVSDPSSSVYERKKITVKYPDGTSIPHSKAFEENEIYCVGNTLFVSYYDKESFHTAMLDGEKKTETHLFDDSAEVSPDGRNISVSSLAGIFLFDAKTKTLGELGPTKNLSKRIPAANLEAERMKVFNQGIESAPELIQWDTDSDGFWFVDGSGAGGWSTACHNFVSKDDLRCYSELPFTDNDESQFSPTARIAVFKPVDRKKEGYVYKVVDLESRKIATLVNSKVSHYTEMDFDKSGALKIQMRQPDKSAASHYSIVDTKNFSQNELKTILNASKETSKFKIRSKF